MKKKDEAGKGRKDKRMIKLEVNKNMEGKEWKTKLKEKEDYRTQGKERRKGCKELIGINGW